MIFPLAPFLSVGHPANVAGPAMPSTFCFENPWLLHSCCNLLTQSSPVVVTVDWVWDADDVFVSTTGSLTIWLSNASTIAFAIALYPTERYLFASSVSTKQTSIYIDLAFVLLIT